MLTAQQATPSWLTPDELRALTCRRQGCAQAKALVVMGIPFRKRPNGSIVVFRADLQTSSGAAGQVASTGTGYQPANGINWSKAA